MSKATLNKRMNKLKEEYHDNIDTINEFNRTINVIRSDISNKEERIALIKEEVEEIKNKLYSYSIKANDNMFNEDEFKNSFVRASYYCSDKSYDDRFSYVRIGEDEISATDGTRGIVIKCDTIPDELKNSSIKWDVREDFERNKRETSDKLDVSAIIDECRSNIIFGISIDDLIDDLLVESIKVADTEIAMLHLDMYSYDIKVAFDKEFIKDLLASFENKYAKIYFPKDSLSPMVIEEKNKQQEVFILPIRLDQTYYK